jgi:hypothetical protein
VATLPDGLKPRFISYRKVNLLHAGGTSTWQGGNYPDTYREFVQIFPDDTACMKYLVGVCAGLKGSSVLPATLPQPRGIKVVTVLLVQSVATKLL